MRSSSAIPFDGLLLNKLELLIMLSPARLNVDVLLGESKFSTRIWICSKFIFIRDKIESIVDANASKPSKLLLFGLLALFPSNSFLLFLSLFDLALAKNEPKLASSCSFKHS